MYQWGTLINPLWFQQLGFFICLEKSSPILRFFKILNAGLIVLFEL